jgi:hypothetical protein
MADYLTLNGFTNITDLDLQNAIQQSIISFFDWGFLNMGGFTNIKINQNDIRGSSRSTLQLVKDPNFTDGKVWETFRQNLVYESGLTSATQPISISGVFINNCFVLPSHPQSGFYVNYPDGLVVFNNPIPTNSVVNMEYSFKTINIINTQVVPLIKEAQSYSFNLTNNDYSASSGDWNQLSRKKIQFPLVNVEFSPKVTSRPYEMGDFAQFVHSDILMHVITEDQSSAMKFASMIFAQKEKSIYMYNMQMASASGAMPLDGNGARTPSGLLYPKLVALSNQGGYRTKILRFADASCIGPNNAGTIYHSVVRFTTEVIA